MDPVSVTVCAKDESEGGGGMSKKDVLPSGRTFLMNYLTQSSQTLLEVLSLFLSIVISTLIGKQDVVR